jgi:adenosylmethionine-8-amino-7-oxononanoate aminotransferase
MKDYEQFIPLKIQRASGDYIELENGQRIIDAISSWWCKSLGHNHPRLKQAIKNQIDHFEHVILANTQHDVITKLSVEIAKLTQHKLNRVFYAGDGSSAVEIALKMSLHAQQLKGEHQRTRFIALKNGYHGETTGAMSVSDVGRFKDPYLAILFQTHYIQSFPYINGRSDPKWFFNDWKELEIELEPLINNTAAIILEPMIQGAGGMLIYPPNLLVFLRRWCDQHGIYLIADEIMTGIGRTGKMLAVDHAEITPDFLCLSKGLTSGWMPFSTVSTHQAVFDLFYDDYKQGKSFLHSHTYSGNALGASVALACLNIIEEEKIAIRAENLENKLHRLMNYVADQTNKLTNIRALGAVVAADLIPDSNIDRPAYQIYQKAVEMGALLRPIGNTLYWLPPLTVADDTLTQLAAITEKAITSCLK